MGVDVNGDEYIIVLFGAVMSTATVCMLRRRRDERRSLRSTFQAVVMTLFLFFVGTGSYMGLTHTCVAHLQAIWTT
jgi:hypothetical protein